MTKNSLVFSLSPH